MFEWEKVIDWLVLIEKEFFVMIEFWERCLWYILVLLIGVDGKINIFVKGCR